MQANTHCFKTGLAYIFFGHWKCGTVDRSNIGTLNCCATRDILLAHREHLLEKKGSGNVHEFIAQGSVFSVHLYI